MTPVFETVGVHVAEMTWTDLTPPARSRVALVLLDTLGCALAARRLGVHGAFVRAMQAMGGTAEATVWFEGCRLPAPHAALLNGTVAHHIEMDDGHPRASLHGGVTIMPAALAAAELAGCDGRTLLAAVAAGYTAAVACGRPMLDGIARHRLHPPAMVGCFGAAAAAARAMGLSGTATTGALALAGSLLPTAPFDAFTKGAPVKDLYGGWPAYIGVMSALLTREGLAGPPTGFEAPDDGVASVVCHGPPAASQDPDTNEIAGTHFKAYATCRSVQPALTALERLLPLDPSAVDSMLVETYPFAVGLSDDSDAATAIGAKTSIPYCVATLLEEGAVGPDAFTPAALASESRRRLAERVTVRVADDMVEPLIRGARVTLRLVDGAERRSQVTACRWSADAAATDGEIREKFRMLARERGEAIEEAVRQLESTGDIERLLGAVQ